MLLQGTVNIMKLWVFGDSLSLAYHVESKGWPELLAGKLNCEYTNFAQPAADNFFIYSSYLHALPEIKSNDIVVIGWSHPSRKSFVFDKSNPEHLKSVETSHIYKTDIEFIRSKNQLNDTLTKWKTLSPVPQNKLFYDTWYRDYYSITEQRSNLFAYHSSAISTCPGYYIPFFFSLESIEGLSIDSYVGTMLEFISANQCSINPTDAHLNSTGHCLWADNIFSCIKQSRNKTLFPMIELIDRYTIAKLKFSKTQANLEEVEFYKQQLRCYNLDLVSDMVDELYQIHAEIWRLEAELKSGQEHKLSFEELGKRAVAIRNFNHRRIELKNKIADTFGDVVKEIKKDHLSQ